MRRPCKCRARGAVRAPGRRWRWWPDRGRCGFPEPHAVILRPAGNEDFRFRIAHGVFQQPVQRLKQQVGIGIDPDAGRDFDGHFQRALRGQQLIVPGHVADEIAEAERRGGGLQRSLLRLGGQQRALDETREPRELVLQVFLKCRRHPGRGVLDAHPQQHQRRAQLVGHPRGKLGHFLIGGARAVQQSVEVVGQALDGGIRLGNGDAAVQRIRPHGGELAVDVMHGPQRAAGEQQARHRARGRSSPPPSTARFPSIRRGCPGFPASEKLL